MDGRFVWKKDLGPQAMEDSLGEGSSPALLGTTLIVVVDHELRSLVVAIDKRSGESELLICDRSLSNLSNLTTNQDCGGPFDLSGVACVLRSRPHVQFGLDSLL